MPGVLKKCARNFCIIEALVNTQRGDLENGLVFAGEHVARISEIMPVQEVFAQLLAEVEKE